MFYVGGGDTPTVAENAPVQNTEIVGPGVDKSEEKGAYTIYMKKGEYGDDLRQKILIANKYLHERGFTDEERLWLIAMIDHESAGTWSETVVGDNGCSTGIAQFNACAGNVAEKTFEGQLRQFSDRMEGFLAKWPLEIAVGKHNMPAWDSNPGYVNRIKAAIDTFYIQ